MQSFGSQPATTMHSACNSTDCLLRTAMTTTLGAADACCSCSSTLTPRPEVDPLMHVNAYNYLRVSPARLDLMWLGYMLQLHQPHDLGLMPEPAYMYDS